MSYLVTDPQILCCDREAEWVQAQLEAAGFADAAGARRAWQRLARIWGAGEAGSREGGAWRRGAPALLAALAQTASPDRALLNLERLAEALRLAGDPPDEGEPSSPGTTNGLLDLLAGDIRLRDMLVTLLAGSQFLSEILIRRPWLLERLGDARSLALRKSADQFYREARGRAREAVGAGGMEAGGATRERAWGGALRAYQHEELLRIGLCDLAGLLALPQVTAQLSNLADALVRVCLEDLFSRMEPPDGGARNGDGSGAVALEDFSVVAMGKLGGGELNYSSDIDLLFLAQKNAPAYEPLGRRLIEALSRVTAEGFLYRVDMRLRPWGTVGPLVSSVGGYIAYMEKSARLWEKQALLKARAMAGNIEMGHAVLERVAPLVYEAAPEIARADVLHSKERIEDQLREQGLVWGEVKLGQGSIRDVEFVAQYLQLAWGDAYPEVRSHNTLDALARLAARRLLAPEDYRVLVDGYTFLRPVEHYLQMMDYRQTHLLPGDGRELAYLARRLGFQGAQAGARFLAHYEQHTAAVRRVFRRYLVQGYDHGAATHLEDEEAMMPDQDRAEAAVRRHLARMTATYEATYSEAEIAHHAQLAERLDADNLVEVEAAPGASAGTWTVTLVGYDYPGELSIICGLLFAYGFNILEGDIFTYEAEAREEAGAGDRARGGARAARKIVDVFSVSPVLAPATAETWARYSADLAALLRRLQAGQQTEAHGEIANRVAAALREMERASQEQGRALEAASGTLAPDAGNRARTPALHPVAIEIDNDLADDYTVLHIEAADTVGFLYEFTSALALNDIYIAQVNVRSIAAEGPRGSGPGRARDTFFLTDARGNKIASAEKQRELRAATVLVKHFTHLLRQSPNPDTALVHFREFLGDLFRQPDWPDQLSSLERPEVLGALARLLGVSEFLWEDFLRMQYTNLFPVVRDVDALARPKSRDELRAELAAAVSAETTGEGQRAALNAFKDREMFRVDMRHIMGHTGETDGTPGSGASAAATFAQFSAELADLAEVVVEGAWRIVDEELRARHGPPLLEDAGNGGEGRAATLAICALGKCGGRELGFASDIELMFVFAGNGPTGGPETITTAEYYEKLVVGVVGAIRAKREGIFEIDLQLRPYGRAGSMAVSLEAFRRYFGPGGAAWPYERQALIKMRLIAGDAVLGGELLALRDEYVYSGEPYDVAAMRAMRERQLRHLVTPGVVNAKYGPGGLVDIEYLVQALQINHGREHPALRLTNTDEAIGALGEAGILPPAQAARLREAHSFVRRLIDALRMVRGNARDLNVPPSGSEEFGFLAQRLGYGEDPARLAADLRFYAGQVQEASARLLGEG